MTSGGGWSGHSDRSSGARSSGSYRSESRSVYRGNEQQYRGNAQQYQYRGNTQPQQDQYRGNTRPQYEYRGNTQPRVYDGNVSRETVQPRVYSQNGNWRGNASRGPVYSQRAVGRGNVSLPRGVERDRFHYVPGWHGGGGGVAPYRANERVTSYGRVERYERWHGGYRVWLGGGLYPIWVPFDYWTRFPLRVGLYIHFGGWWDPFGYWHVYDYSPYYGYDGYDPSYYGGAYTSGVVQGVVESVDLRRGTMVVNDDTSHQFVTIELPRDRRMEQIRPGDYVSFSGDWNRAGVFDAYRLERWDYGRDGGAYNNYDPNYNPPPPGDGY